MSTALTNFPNGLTSFGVPVFGGGFGVTQGTSWFVAPGTGSDNNSGLSPAQAFDTLAKAHSMATANQNDVVYLFAQSNTASATTDYQSATLTWSKDMVHLIGVNCGNRLSQRSRVAQLSTATGVSPLVLVSANGCLISNIEFFHGVADATSLINVKVTGMRNHFVNCHFAGIGNSTMVTTGATSLNLSGAEENYFEKCTIGIDTITRTNAILGELSFDTTAKRNTFEGCRIVGFTSNAGYFSVTVTGVTGVDSWTTFDDCLFMVESANNATGQTSVMSLPAFSGVSPVIILKNSMVSIPTGTPNWDSNSRGVIRNNAVAAAASAAGGKATAL